MATTLAVFLASAPGSAGSAGGSSPAGRSAHTSRAPDPPPGKLPPRTGRTRPWAVRRRRRLCPPGGWRAGADPAPGRPGARALGRRPRGPPSHGHDRSRGTWHSFPPRISRLALFRTGLGPPRPCESRHFGSYVDHGFLFYMACPPCIIECVRLHSVLRWALLSWRREPLQSEAALALATVKRPVQPLGEEGVNR